MRLPRLTIRGRVFAGYLVLSLAAVAAMSVAGFKFMRALRDNAHENCTRIAGVFRDLARDHVASFAARAGALTAAMSRSGWSEDSVTKWLHDNRGSGYSWAVYDARGSLVAGGQPDDVADELDRLGIGRRQLSPSECRRLDEARRGRPGIVLAPGRKSTCVLVYKPIPRQGESRHVLQVAARVPKSLIPTARDARSGSAVLRPFISSADPPHLVSLSDGPHIVTSLPLVYAGRHLGSVTAAIPYAKEARYERTITLSIGGFAVCAFLILVLASSSLSRAATVPLEQVRQLVSDLQEGREAEHRDIALHGELAALLAAYRQAQSRSQEWVDRLMQHSRALRELLWGSVQALVGAIEAKHKYTGGHSQAPRHRQDRHQRSGPQQTRQARCA